MSQENINAFGSELERVINYFRKEFDLTYAEVVGTLQIITHMLIDEAVANVEEEEE